MSGTAKRRTSSITGAQLNAARQLLGWTYADLARACGVSRGTINRLILCPEWPLRATAETLDSIERVLTAAGVELIDGNGSGASVRLREGKGS